MFLCILHDARAPSSERWNYLWARNSTNNFAKQPTSMIHSRVLLCAVNLWHGTDGFTPPPKEGVLRIFLPLKIRRLWPGLNPRRVSLVTKQVVWARILHFMPHLLYVSEYMVWSTSFQTYCEMTLLIPAWNKAVACVIKCECVLFHLQFWCT
jgi:hypothetical protein